MTTHHPRKNPIPVQVRRTSGSGILPCTSSAPVRSAASVARTVMARRCWRGFDTATRSTLLALSAAL